MREICADGTYFPNNLRTDAHITQLRNVQFSPVSCCCLPLMPAHLPQHPIIEHPQPKFLPSCCSPQCRDTTHLSGVVLCQTALHSTCNKYTCICSYGIIIITVDLESSVKIVSTLGYSLKRATSCLTPVLKETVGAILRVQSAAATSVQRPGRVADRSSPPSATVKKEWSYTSIPTYTFLRQSGLLGQDIYMLQMKLQKHGSV